MNPREFDAYQPRPVRFAPDPLDHALLALDGVPGAFRPEMIGLICDEAPLNGAGLVLRDHPRLVPRTPCIVKVGRMDPVRAQIVWRRELPAGLVQLGLQYLE